MKTREALYSVLLLVVLMGAWQLASMGSHPLLDPLFFSSPPAVWAAFLEYAASGTLIEDLLRTLEGAMAGLFLGLVTGVGAGMLLGKYRALNGVVSPFLTALNSLPRPALAPLLIIWFGVGIFSKIFLAWSLVFFVVLFNTLYGIRAIDADYVRAIRVMGAGESQISRIVIIPSLLTWVFAAFRTSVSLALIGAVIGEFVGAQAGLGYRIVMAAGLFQTDKVFVILLILMIVGSVLVALAEWVERIVLKWRPASFQM